VTDLKIQEILHFVGDYSHDMKNMLQPIVMGSGLLKEELQKFFKGFRILPRINQLTVMNVAWNSLTWS
jgi:hypothetical protein